MRIPLSRFATALSGIAVTQQTLASASGCQVNCVQPCQQLTQQQISWSQASFATKITAATKLVIYNNVIDATRTIIQYNPDVVDFTTITSDGVEATYVGGYTVTSVAHGPEQTSRTATYVETNAGVASTVTATFGTVLSILQDTISWSGTVPTTLQGTPTCLTHTGFDAEILPSVATATSVQPIASNEGYLGLNEDPYGIFWTPVYKSDVTDGEDQTYLAQFYPQVAALFGATCPIAPNCNLPRPRAARPAKRQQGATSSGTAMVITQTSSVIESSVTSVVVPAPQSQVAANSSVASTSPTTTPVSSSTPVSGSVPSSSAVSSTSVSSSGSSSSVPLSQTLVVGQPLSVVFSTVSNPASHATSPTSSVVLLSSTTTKSAISVIPIAGGSSTISVSASTTISLQSTATVGGTAAAASGVTSAPLLSVSPSLLYNGSTATFALTLSSVAVLGPSANSFTSNKLTSGYPNATSTRYRNATATGIVPYTGNAAPASFEARHQIFVDLVIVLLGCMLRMWLW